MNDPFSEDTAIAGAAETAGMEMLRLRPITISDRKALKDAGLMREAPDYQRIRALLNSGVEVKGAAFGPVEYVLRRPGVTESL